MKCADCQCIPELCRRQSLVDCKFCIKDDCCCVEIHLKGNKPTLKNFAIGIERIPQVYKIPDFGQIMKSSLYVLITGESVCILTAETVNLAFFRHALWLSIPLSLLAGAFAITLIEAYRKAKA